MAVQKKSGSVKRFGARYGRKVKDKIAKIDSLKKTEYKCPYCHKRASKRLSSGIWECKKCGSKFTGRAYNVEEKTQKRLQEEAIAVPAAAGDESETEEKEELLEDEDFEEENKRLLKQAESDGTEDEDMLPETEESEEEQTDESEEEPEVSEEETEEDKNKEV